MSTPLTTTTSRGSQRTPGAPRTEDEMAATGLTWDDSTRSWVNEEDVAREGISSRTSQATAVGAEDKLEKGPSEEVIWLEWEENDPQNPFNWSRRKKWMTTWISTLFTLLVAFTGGAYSIGTTSMMKELNCSSELAVLGLSAFPLGFGLAPLILAPFSEAFGRWPMYVASSVFYLIFFLPVSLGKNIATVIVGRLLGGLAASTGSTLVGGTVADIWMTHERGLPMSIFSLCAFVGTGLGPATMGYVEQNLDWRWIEHIQMIAAAFMCAAIFFLTHETRGSVILSRRAAKLRKETGDERYQCRTDAERDSLVHLVKISMTRPLYLLFTEPVVASFSLWVCFAWGILYLTLRSVPLVFGEVYGFSIGKVGLVFYAVVVAGFLGYAANLVQERLYQRNVATRGPEARLYGAFVGSLIFPAGLFIFAFSAGRGHWMGPVIGLTLAFQGIFAIYCATFTFLADVYGPYASSALSGQSLCRNLAGFAFPLFTSAMYERMGYQWASFLAGMLGLVLGVTPWVLFFYGPRIRARSNFAQKLGEVQHGKA